MANFINKIKIGTDTYNIGMENAVHFDGLAPIRTWTIDEDYTIPATVADLSRDFLYFNKEAINDNLVSKGCMYIPTDNDVATGYELVCVEVKTSDTETRTKWAILGEIKKETKDIVTGISTSTRKVVDIINEEKNQVIGSVTPSTASITYITSVSESPVSVSTGTKDVVVNEASGEASEVAVNLTTNNKTIATGVNVTTAALTNTNSKKSISVSNGVLELPASVLTALALTNVVTSTTASTSSIPIPTAAALATTVVTGITSSPVTKTISVVTEVTASAPKVSTASKTVVTGVITGSVDVVTNISVNTVTINQVDSISTGTVVTAV